MGIKSVAQVAQNILTLAVRAATVILGAFKVPFAGSYHNDIQFNYALSAEMTNRPPKVFEFTDGFNLASSGNIFTAQCAKCGVRGNFSIDGRIAFNNAEGLTGKVSLVNHDPLVIDAIFGITLEAQLDKSVDNFDKQLAAEPFSPLTIPGVFTLGPQLAINGSLDLILNGKAEFLVGGSLSINPGTASLSLANKADNYLGGFQPTFTPVFKAGYPWQLTPRLLKNGLELTLSYLTYSSMAHLLPLLN